MPMVCQPAISCPARQVTGATADVQQSAFRTIAIEQAEVVLGGPAALGAEIAVDLVCTVDRLVVLIKFLWRWARVEVDQIAPVAPHIPSFAHVEIVRLVEVGDNSISAFAAQRAGYSF